MGGSAFIWTARGGSRKASRERRRRTRAPRGAFLQQMLEPGAAEGKGRGLRLMCLVVAFHSDWLWAAGSVGDALLPGSGPVILPCG